MKLIRTEEDMRRLSESWRCEGLTVGFVPTMGALHKGHMSLINRCTDECDRCVVSIYVNPIQFGPKEDFNRYPRPFESDIKKCRMAGVDAVFAPDDKSLYPEDFGTYVEPHTELSACMCGKHRPGHFRGVCTIVAKLFNIIRPHRAYFGQKDYQQFLILKKMVEDLNFGVEMVCCPIVREPDGLAHSSRNAYLSKEERVEAVCLRRALDAAVEMVKRGERRAEKIIAAVEDVLSRFPLAQPQYVELRDAHNLKPLLLLDKAAVLGIALYLGGTRLIDNALLLPERGEVFPDDV